MRHLVHTQTPYVIETDFFGEPIASYVVPRVAPTPPNPERRAALYRLEDELRLLEPFECPLTHHFAAGVYVRSMLIPQGVAIVGHIHRHACVNVVQFGEIEVATEAGRKRIVGPCTFESLPGTKRAGYALRDTLWTTIHANPTDERDIDKLEAFLIIPREEGQLESSCKPSLS
jgi:hypothetical protein